MNIKIKTAARIFAVAAMFLPLKTWSIELVTENPTTFAQSLKQQVLMAGVELLLEENGVQRVIPPTHELKTGDRIRLRLRTTVDSEYKLLLLDKQGKEAKLELLTGQTSAQTTMLVPSPEQGIFELDAKTGVEWLQLVVSSKNQQQHKSAVVSNKHPHGKIEQIILRNVELLAPPAQKVHYDPVEQIIYFSQKKPVEGVNVISLKLGLSHSASNGKI